MSFFTLITFFTLFVCTFAFPLSLGKRDISDQQLSTFSLIEQYAAAAYCKENNDAAFGNITCSSGNCPSVQDAGATSVLEFENVGFTDATGFVAIDHINKLIVLSYRGSRSLSNWIGNINIGFVPFSPCQGCLVHGGFMSSWEGSRDEVLSAVQKAQSNNPSYSMVFTGHSLGAAVATLAAAELRQQGLNIALYTYGSPMVGNGKFANFVTNQAGGNYRVTHKYDAVPKLPGYFLDYRHVSPEYWVTSGDQKSVNLGDIRVSSGTFNLWGNQGTLFTTITDHLWYFNAISSCSGGGFEL